jgi:phospholipase A1
MAAGAGLAQAQAPAASGDSWKSCSSEIDSTARLACFDRWAAAQMPAVVPLASAAAGQATWAGVSPPVSVPAEPAEKPATARDSTLPDISYAQMDDNRLCTDPRSSPLSRFWELEPASDCGTFGLRGYRPLSLSWIGSDSVNTAPSSPSAGHTATTPVNYSTSETRIQLSVRTKIARGLLTGGDSHQRDSLWFGYTQQSYWQLFNGNISRPFRSTDHEPELTYILPLDSPLDGGWRLRFGGLSLNHQSNGQSLPLSRSWNRIILMAGMEKGPFSVTGRAWARVPERSDQDDNPDIADYIGRAEVAAAWQVNKLHTLGVTLRHSLRSAARGSVRLEWLRAIGTPRANGESGGLRFHTQLFSGYGDSLLDYNRRRTVLSVGLSLVDF